MGSSPWFIKKFTGLARVMAGKYDWKPGQGVRSVSDVFNLIVELGSATFEFDMSILFGHCFYLLSQWSRAILHWVTKWNVQVGTDEAEKERCPTRDAGTDGLEDASGSGPAARIRNC
jgi:hypothetical protein